MPDLLPAELNAEAILATLNRHRVKYVVIGGFAAILRGLPSVTIDVDIVPETSPANVDRLARALKELKAKLRASGVDELLAIPLDRHLFEQFSAFVNLRTTHGDLDISLHPAAPDGLTFTYERLMERAEILEIPEPVPVASLDDVIASKTAANRPKDRAVLHLLEELRDQIRRQESKPTT